MTIGINTSPLAGREGKKLTARLVKNRLDAELVGNVSIRVLPTERPDAWEVQARGELQLAILVEQMRREGFELNVGKPVVLTHEVDGKLHEPVERVTIDVPQEHLGAVTQLLASRKGRMQNMTGSALGAPRLPGAGSWAHRVPHRVPHRDPRHRCDQPHVRGLRAVGRRDPLASVGRAGGRPHRSGNHLRHAQPAGPCRDDGRPGHRGVLRHDRRRELAGGRHGRQHLPREEDDQRAGLVGRRDREAHAAQATVARRSARVHRRRRVRRGDPAEHPPAQGRSRPHQPAPATPSAAANPP